MKTFGLNERGGGHEGDRDESIWDGSYSRNSGVGRRIGAMCALGGKAFE